MNEKQNETNEKQHETKVEQHEVNEKQHGTEENQHEENEKQHGTKEKQHEKNEKHQNHSRRKNPFWNWMTPPFDQNQAHFMPNMNFQNNDFASHFLNLSHNLTPNQPYPYNQRNHSWYKWNKHNLMNNRNKNNRNVQANKIRGSSKRQVQAISNRNQPKNTKYCNTLQIPCPPQKTSEKLKSIETSCKSSQNKSDISETEKERLKKVEEERQRIKMALTKKDGSTPLDFKTCISTLPNEEEMKETNMLKLSCPNNQKIVLSESDFREIGIMNDRKDNDISEDSSDGVDSLIDSEESANDSDCQIFSPEETTNEISQLPPSRLKDQIHSEESLNECSTPLSPGQENQEMPACSSKDLQEKQIDAHALESYPNVENNSEEIAQKKVNKKKSREDEVVLGYIERNENLHCVEKVENKLKELNNYGKILSMYKNFMRYRHFAQKNTNLFDRLKLNRSENLENPLLNREVVDQLKNTGDYSEKANAETRTVETFENRTNVEEVDEFIAIFGDLLDENCTIPADALCRLGLGSLIFEGEENFDTSNDLLPSDAESLLSKNIKQEPVDVSDEIHDEEPQSELGFQEPSNAPVVPIVKQEFVESEIIRESAENLNQSKVVASKTLVSTTEISSDYPPSTSPNYLDNSCNNLSSNFNRYSAPESTDRFLGSLGHEKESQTAFDPNSYNKASCLEDMKVCHYIEKKMMCASILDCEPFEVAKSVIHSFGKDLLKFTKLSPALETSFKSILSMIKNLEDSDQERENVPRSLNSPGDLLDVNSSEKRKYETSEDDSCSQHFKRVKRVEPTVNETFINNLIRPDPTAESSSSKTDGVDKETEAHSDSESESDDELMEEKTSESVIRPSNEISVNVDVNYRIQSAVDSCSTSNCPTRIKTLKMFGDDLLLGCCDGLVIRLTKDNSKSRVYRGHTDSVNCISGYKNVLLSGSSDGTVRVSCLLHPYLSVHKLVLEEEVSSFEVMWGKLFVGTINGSVFRCNIKNFENCTIYKIMVGSKRSPILDIKASREGPRKILIVSVRSNPLTIRDARNGLLLHTFDIVDVVYSFAHSVSSTLVYCGTRNKSLVALDLVTGYVRRKFQLGKSVVKVILRSNLLYTAAYNGTVHVYNLEEDKILYSNSTPRPIIDMEVWCNQMVIIMDNCGVITYNLPYNF